ncbi:MAG: formylglycine-generating enzyme family protein [Campylobacteraceae bacterium]|nr:formylglycine-generating enzyme family protein [Campylobacteraceae bacterium]
MSIKYFPAQPNLQLEPCSCPLSNLNPETIEKSFDKNKKDEPHKFYNELEINTYLNSVAKVLGYRAWNDYLKAYDNEMTPFLKENGLTDYVKDEKQILSSAPIINLTLRQISDRLFLSGRPLPKAIFSGHNCKMDYIHFYASHLNEYLGYPIEYFNHTKILIKTEEYEKITSDRNIDFMIPIHVSNFIQYANLIGDMFIKNDDNVQNEYLYQSYEHYRGLVKQEEYIKIAQHIHELFLKSKKGWIAIIPFSKHLIFLKADDGKYDFVFKNLRTEKHCYPHEGYIKHKYIPSAFREDYDFERWQYFGFRRDEKSAEQTDLWHEKDRHEAEVEFYANNELFNYPSTHEIMKNYYIKKGLYKPYNKQKIKPKKIDSFNKVEIDNKTLYVSNCITIEEFSRFCEETNYKNDRSKKLQEIETVNYEEKDMPVSVTWYDAIAYCKWMEDLHKVNARLLAKEEFYRLCPKTNSNKSITDPLCNRCNYDTKIDNTVSLYDYKYSFESELIFIMDSKEFHLDNKIIMQWRKPLQYIEKNALKFCINETFLEWSSEKGITLSALYQYEKMDNSTLYMYFFAPDSNNKYKHIKTCFRVCYEEGVNEY